MNQFMHRQTLHESCLWGCPTAAGELIQHTARDLSLPHDSPPLLVQLSFGVDYVDDRRDTMRHGRIVPLIPLLSDRWGDTGLPPSQIPGYLLPPPHPDPVHMNVINCSLPVTCPSRIITMLNAFNSELGQAVGSKAGPSRYVRFPWSPQRVPILSSS